MLLADAPAPAPSEGDSCVTIWEVRSQRQWQQAGIEWQIGSISSISGSGSSETSQCQVGGSSSSTRTQQQWQIGSSSM